MKVASGDAIQLMQVYRADKPSKHMQVATITYPVEASAATRRNAHNLAGTFSVNAKGSVEAFNNAASEAAQGERTIRGLEDSREVARWAYGAETGDLSEIFTVGNDYVVATLTEIDDNEYTPIDKVAAQVRAQVLRDKKYDYITKQIAGTTLDEQAASLGSEVADFDGVTFGAFYVNGPGVGFLGCDVRRFLCQRRGCRAPSGRRHRFDDRERRPVGSGEGHVGGLCFPGG